MAGTASGAVNTPTVDVLFSDNNGASFDYVLAAATPNDGAQTVVLPDVTTSQGRILIRAVGNVFFNVNAQPFSVTPDAGSDPPVLSYSPSSLSFSLGTGATDSEEVTLSNTAAPGSDDLDFSAFITNFAPLAAQDEQGAERRSAAAFGFLPVGAAGARTAEAVVYSGVDATSFMTFGAPAGWATVSPSNGSITAEGSDVLTVDVDATGLGDGIYTADLVVTTNDPNNPSVTIPITLTVEGGTPGVLAVAVVAPAAVPRRSTIQYDVIVQNLGDAPVMGTVTTQFVLPNSNTLSDASFSGTLPPGASVTRTFSRSVPNNAPLGTYTLNATARDGGGNVLGMGDDVFDVTPTVSVASATADVPDAASLVVATDVPVTVGPNPASGAARFSFGLAEAADVRLAVYDALGREVAVVAEGAMSAGAHAPMLQTSALPTGVYVWRLTAGARVESGRFTVVR